MNKTGPESLESRGTLVPVPDPTDKTTQLVYHEIFILKEMLITRLIALEKAQDVFSDNITRVPTQLDKEIKQLCDLIYQRFSVNDEKFTTMVEKFASVQTQFTERDIRVEQTAKDSKVAVDAALQAAKEAVGEQNKSSGLSIAKSEAATTKQIEQQAVIFATTSQGFTNSITDLKDRITRIEGSLLANQEGVVGRRAQVSSSTQMLGVATAIIFGLISLAVSILWHVGK